MMAFKDQNKSADKINGIGSDTSAHKENSSEPQKSKTRGFIEKFGRPPKFALWLAFGLCLLTTIGYICWPKAKTETAPQVAIAAPAEQQLIFDSFVIPFKASDQFAYIALSLSFDFTNSRLRREMTEKKEYLRGVIYDILEKEINRQNKVPAAEELKVFVVRGVNNFLSAGSVNEAYIIDFLAV